ncbi:MAG: winged helix-turn-helix domain-containing protein [Alloprevotella sp.]
MIHRPTRFWDAAERTFTSPPMQHRLMKMFLAAPRHQLSHQAICQTLWPKKDQPADTLYALIKRLKPILEEQMNVKIECQRGQYYRLTADETSHP